MDVKEWSDATTWDAFVGAQPEAQFLQSWSWGEFQAAVGRAVWRLALVREGNFVGAMQCIVQRHPMGIVSCNVYRGPIIDASLSVADYTSALELLLEHLATLGRTFGATYLHLEAPFGRQSPQASLMREQSAWRIAPSSQPQNTLLLDLAHDEETLLAQMHEKTRYNIRLAERKGVRIEELREPDAIDAFLHLTHVTAARDGIRAHPDHYYQTFLRTLAPRDVARLFVAWFGENVISANLVVAFGDTVTYVHGASANEQRNVMAPYLLQWKQIQWARIRSARFYDFEGIKPPEALERHRWSGITRFKKGFGGDERQYLHALDRPIQSLKYFLVQTRRKLR